MEQEEEEEEGGVGFAFTEAASMQALRMTFFYNMQTDTE